MSPRWTGSLTALWRRLRRRPPELEPAEGYRRWARDFDRQPNALQRLEAEARTRLLPDLAGSRVLDAGCGKGRAGRLALDRGAASCVGADLTLAMLAGAARAGSSRRLAARAEALPLRAHSFDTVISALLLGHVADLAGAVAEMARVLVPGGHLVITSFHPSAARRGWLRTFCDPCEGRTYSITHYPHHVSDYLATLRAAGLEVEEMAEPQWRGQPVILALRARKPA